MEKRIPNRFFKQLSLLLILLLLMSAQFAAAQTPIFNSSMSISPLGSVSSPGGEQYYNIIDGNIYSKFLDFSAFDGFGFTVSIGAPKTATSISITTANDSPSRDPMNYQVLGSNDGSNFTSVATGSIACNGSRYYTRNFTFSNSTSYSYYRVNFTNTCGDSMFQLAEVQLYMPQCFPSLNSQPQATSVCVGNSATFSVSGSGIGLTYQWLKNNTAIVGATQSTFVVNNASVSNAGNYSCQLSASCGTITSNAVALTVNSMPNVSYAGVATNYPINAPIPNLTASNVGGNAVSNGIVTTTYASGFNYPNGVAVDGQGILYVTDTNNNQVLKIDSNGSYSAINYGFNGPFDVVAGPSGIVYVANTYTNEILKVETNGTVSFFANGFSSPQGLGLDISGNVYVADMYNGRIVKLDSAGSVVQIWNGFYYPMDVAVTASGIIYVTEPYNSSVKKIDNFGNITSLYYPNYSYPQGIVASPSGSVFVANTNNSEILEILPDDTVSVFSSFYYSPFGIAIDANGAFYISDQNSYDVKKLVETGFYAVAPSLPAGLNFNTETGLISGTPTQVTSSTTYVISSHNDCGVNNASINFATTNPCVFPVITNQPIAQTVCKNSTVTLSIAATGTGLTYQWNKAGTPISGQTNSSLSLSNVQVADAVIYTVTVTGDCGTVTSQDTTLTVNDVNTSGAVNYVSCYGGSDGSLEVFPSGGTAPYTYLWSNGVTTSLNAGIPSGWYTCLITDFIGCTYTYAFYITEPSPVATPTGVSIQTVSSGATLASLNVSGSNINWYAQPSSGTLLSSNTVIVGGTTYYASQTINGCESPVRLAVTVHIAAGALNYDGNNDIVQFGETLGNFGTGDFSIQLKVKTTLNRTYLLSKRSTCNNDNFLSINIGDGHVGVETSNINIPGSGLSFSGSAIINNGVWHQITLTRVSGTLTIYVDGVLDALVNPTTPQNASVDLNNNYNLQLGGFAPCTPYGGNAPFQGSFDEVRFWSRGLCIDEIQNNYNCEVQTTGNGLLANYHFNQGFEGENNASITSLLDSSGNGFTGVLSNFNLSGSQSNWTSDVAVTSGVSCGAVILNYATYYRDLDNDGFGDLNNTIVFCSQPFGYVTNSLDCNDNQLQYTDADGDGLGVLPLVACGVANNTDCNDSNPNAAPGDTLSTAIPVNSANYFTTGNTASCYTNTTGNQSPDVWYKVFLDPCATSLTVSTCSGTNYDSWIWIYAEDGSSYLAYNDDYCGLQSYLGNINITGHSFVYVVVEGWSNSTGTFGLNIVQNINPTITYYADADGDTYGDFNISQISCSGAPVGYVTNNLDCNDANAAIHPGVVDVCRDGIDNDCNGVIDNVGQPGGCVPVVTTMQAAICGSTVSAFTTTLLANTVTGTQGYRFKITKIDKLTNLPIGAAVTIDRPVNNVALSNVAGIAYDSKYQFEVALKLGAVWQPFFGSPCFVNTPNPVSTIALCGGTLTTMNQFISTTVVPNVSAYRFRVTQLNALLQPVGTPQEITQGLNKFNMTQLVGILYATTYRVEVSLRNTDGTFLDYNAPCTVTTPNYPVSEVRATQCDHYQVTSATEYIVAVAVSGATRYRFRVFGPSYNFTYDSGLNKFNLINFPGLVAGQNYSVEVAVKIGGQPDFGPYSKTCSIIVPGTARTVVGANPKLEVSIAFEALAYPNPFAENFKLEVTTNSSDDLRVSVYDMLGKLVEDRKVSASDVQTLEVGNNYPSGVYNVIVSQGEHTKTLRVIKR